MLATEVTKTVQHHFFEIIDNLKTAIFRKLTCGVRAVTDVSEIQVVNPLAEPPIDADGEYSRGSPPARKHVTSSRERDNR